MKNVFRKIQERMQNERGATMVEYALMVSLIAVVAIAAVTLIGGNVTTTFGTIAAAL